MNKTFLAKSSFQMVTAVTLLFMSFNAFLPLNFSFQTEVIEYPFKLTLMLEKTMYRVGEPVNLTLMITNIGAENVTLYNSREWWGWEIYDANLLRVYRVGFGHLPAIYPLATLPPGGNVTVFDTWYQTLERTYEEIIQGLSKRAPPGTYYIVGIFHSANYNVTRLETSALKIYIGG